MTVHLIRVAEHLGASSRRPRHPFPALMAGGQPWPCACAHGPKNSSRHAMNSTIGSETSTITRQCDASTRAAWCFLSK